MKNKHEILQELEKKYQAVVKSGHALEELFAINREYFSCLEEELKENPRNIGALIYLGVLSWEPFHQQEKAIQYLEKAIQYDSKNVEARFWLAKCYYHDFCAYKKARDILVDALQIDPKRSECFALLGSIIMDTTKVLEEAIDCYKKAVEYAPDWPIIRHSLARLYLDKEDYVLAEQQIEEIFKRYKPLSETPKNFIEDYYESIVTGRGWSDLQKEFKELVSDIQEVKGKL